MTWKIFILMSCLLVFAATAYGNTDSTYEAIIRLSNHQLVILPDAESEVGISDKTIKSFPLYFLFSKYRASSIRRTYPKFGEADTILTSQHGVKVRLGNCLYKTFTVRFDTREGLYGFLSQVPTYTSIKNETDRINALIKERNLGNKELKAIQEAVANDQEIMKVHRQNSQHPEILVAGRNFAGEKTKTLEELLCQLPSDPETNLPLQAPTTTSPNDPMYYLQWGLRTDGINSLLAWDYVTRSYEVIAVLDCGLFDHRDLLESGYMCGYLDWHGTSVGGIIAAITNNSQDISGVVTYPTTLLSVFVGDADVEGISNALIWGIPYAGIYNLSCGIYNSDSENLELAWAAARSLDADIFSAVATGNQGFSYPVDPCKRPGICAVGGMTKYRYVSDFSNGFYYNYGVIAPAGDGDPLGNEDIWSLITVDPWTYPNWGTSLAAPHVAGAAGLLSWWIWETQGIHPTRDDIRRVLEITAYDIYPTGPDYESGYGKVQLGKAVCDLSPQSTWRLKHIEESGYDNIQISDYYAMAIYNADGLEPGTYYVKRHDVYKTNYFHPCHEMPQVWMRDPYTTGWLNECWQYGQRGGKVEEVNLNSVTMKASIFKVWEAWGDYYCGCYPVELNNVHFAATVWGHFNLYTPYDVWAGVEYIGGDSNRIHIAWQDTNEFHEGYDVNINGNIKFIPSGYRDYYYQDPYGSRLLNISVRAVINDSVYSDWSNVATCYSPPKTPQNVSISSKIVCGWPSVAKVVPGQLPEEIWCPSERLEEIVDSLNNSMTQAPRPDPDEPPCYGTNLITVSWDPWDETPGQIVAPDYYMVRLLFYISGMSVVYWVGPVYGNEIEFCTWPEYLHRISVVAYKFGLHSNETENIITFTTGESICRNYPFDNKTSEDGQESFTDKSNMPPNQFVLHQNHPNPFNPKTDITYDLPIDCHVTLIIYNVMGQKVATLVDEYQFTGQKIVHWDGQDDSGNLVVTGVYFSRIQAGEFSQTKKMVMLK